MVRKIASSPKKDRPELLDRKFFFGREDYISTFFNTYNHLCQSIDEAPSTPCLLAYYGVGGIGKTSLITEITNRMDNTLAENSFYANIDLETDSCNLQSFLRLIYGQLSDKKGINFPLYEFARYRLDKLLGEKSFKRPKWLNKDSILSIILELGDDITGINISNSIMKLAEKGMLLAQDLRNNNKAEIAAIEQADIHQLNEMLYALFKKDLENFKKNTGFPIVIFIDTFEEFNTDDDWFWDKFIHLPKTMFVFSGRNEIKCGIQKKERPVTIKQIPIGSLSKKCVETWFETVPVSDVNLRDALYALTEGIPLYLSVCLSHYKSLKYQGKNPTIGDFGENKKGLVNRYFRNLEESEQRSLYTLACMNNWITPMINYVGEFMGRDYNTFLVVDYEERLRYSSIIIHTADGISYIHKKISEVILESEKHQYLKNPVYEKSIEFQEKNLNSQSPLDELYEWSLKWLMNHAINNVNNRSELANLFCLKISHYLRTYVLSLQLWYKTGNLSKLFRELSEKAFLTNDEFCASVCQMQSFFFGLGQEWTKAWLYAKKNYEIQLKINGKNSPLFRESIENLADIAPHLEKYDVALKLYEVLLEYNQMKYGKISSSSLHFIYKISHCHNKLGNFEKARQILERVIEVAEKELNEDNARILDLLFLLAETYRKLKKTDLYVLILDKLAQRISNIQEPSIFETYSSRLFVFYDKLDEFQKEALEQAQKCYEHCKKTYGKKHPNTIFNLIMVAKVLSELEEYKKASLLANEAIALGKEILGDDNPCLEPFLEFKKVLDKLNKNNLGSQFT